MGLSQLAEQHGDELFPAGESFCLPFSTWHYNEKEMQRKLSSPGEFQWWVLWLYRFSSGYGERPLRALAMFGILICAACVVLVSLGLKEVAGSDHGFTSIQLVGQFSFDNVKA